MKSTVNVYKQNNEGLIEYYVFLDILEGEGIECPALSNPSGFNYAKADHIISVDWVDSQIKIEEFDMSIANDMLNDEEYSSIHSSIACAVLSASSNNMPVCDFIKELDIDNYFIGSRDAHMPQI